MTPGVHVLSASQNVQCMMRFLKTRVPARTGNPTFQVFERLYRNNECSQTRNCERNQDKFEYRVLSFDIHAAYASPAVGIVKPNPFCGTWFEGTRAGRLCIAIVNVLFFFFFFLLF